jgi:nitrate reductase gamma subunit
MSVLYALLFYVATAVFVGGLVYRISTYWSAPAPLKIPTMPAPTTRSGVAMRMAREVVLFESLFKSNKWIWLFGWLFHVGLLLVVLRHARYFQADVPAIIAFIQPFGIYAGFAMLAGLGGLLVRRLAVERIRYISQPSDYLMLFLLIAIGASGLMLKFVSHTDIVAVKAFFLGLLRFDLGQALPVSGPLYVHLMLVALLMIIFPFSKLLHAPGIFFSPTRNQVDNARDKRHIAPWARELEQ